MIAFELNGFIALPDDALLESLHPHGGRVIEIELEPEYAGET